MRFKIGQEKVIKTAAKRFIETRPTRFTEQCKMKRSKPRTLVATL